MSGRGSSAAGTADGEPPIGLAQLPGFQTHIGDGGSKHFCSSSLTAAVHLLNLQTRKGEDQYKGFKDTDTPSSEEMDRIYRELDVQVQLVTEIGGSPFYWYPRAVKEGDYDPIEDGHVPNRSGRSVGDKVEVMPGRSSNV